jgi:ubiquinone/menaquinone biosynthesis C-methylase UbiE
MEPDMLSYYNQGREQSRLEVVGRLEFIRTQELLHRLLPAPPARVIDVGGAAGIHALPLVAAGYDVVLVDPVQLHIDQARENGITDARVGDARHLLFDDGSVDVALLLGPLYHLTDREDRLTALREARRVTRPGGLLCAAVISKFASTQDGLQLHYLSEPGFEQIVEDDVATGQHRNPTRQSGWFTTAYMHRPHEIEQELVDAGWVPTAMVAVEGTGVFADPSYWLDDSERQATLLRAIRRVEAEPSILGSSPHLLAVGTRPG